MSAKAVSKKENDINDINDINCNNCEDSGYNWDTVFPCKECDLGKVKQHEQNVQELSRLNNRAKMLRKRIKSYEKV